ncbi:MAG: D-2-hydroxyacid dehydrogenase [Bacteroidaceae bacterium]|nr:D-2-hydroxyacid dehydrogenase [Bacteroidaceae bacterium]
MKIVVLDGYTLNPGDLSWEWLGTLGEYQVFERTKPSDVLSRANDADALLTNKVVITAEMMSALPKLKYIGVLATGYNVVDISAARQLGITVTNIPAYSTQSVAQHVFALLLEITNRVGHYAAENTSVVGGKTSRWAQSEDFTWRDTPLTELSGKTMGIIGMGRTGSSVAALSLAFGMKVICYTSKNQQELTFGIEKADIDTVFSCSDVVSLHCPLTSDTLHLVDARRLAMMKPTSILINTSRGPVVDEEALAAALRTNALRAAAVDVLGEEPPSASCPLLTAPRCYITPHIAWATAEARARLMDICRQNLEAFASGKPVCVVN